MNKHKCRVKEMMENNDELSRDLFLNEQDICKLVGKLAKKTYNKHENDAWIIRMWVVENKYKVFFYQENGGQVEGSYTIVMKIVICLSPLAYIQTKWQK
jgi:hypothetical protein